MTEILAAEIPNRKYMKTLVCEQPKNFCTFQFMDPKQVRSNPTNNDI